MVLSILLSRGQPDPQYKTSRGRKAENSNPRAVKEKRPGERAPRWRQNSTIRRDEKTTAPKRPRASSKPRATLADAVQWRRRSQQRKESPQATSTRGTVL